MNELYSMLVWHDANTSPPIPSTILIKFDRKENPWRLAKITGASDLPYVLDQFNSNRRDFIWAALINPVDTSPVHPPAPEPPTQLQTLDYYALESRVALLEERVKELERVWTKIG